MLRKIYLCLCLLQSLTCEPCASPTHDCIPIQECEPLQNIEFTKCGSNLVCCQRHTCLTSDRDPGTCLPVSNCDHVLDLIDRKPFLSENAITFLRGSVCDYNKQKGICCPYNKPTWKKSFLDLLSNDRECGSIAVMEPKYARTTDIYQFPWTVLLEYEKDGLVSLNCEGSLINEQYVLTAAHCTTERFLQQHGKLLRVRLGEYDTNNITDRKYLNWGASMQMDPLVIRDIQYVVPHESYHINKHNDIALIRMSQPVKYTKFIKPICLPREEQSNPVLTVAGWGIIHSNQTSNLKLQARIPLYDHGECTNWYSVTEEQLCAGGLDGCGEYVGTLLMSQTKMKNKKLWYLIGVRANGPYRCRDGVPTVYTSIAKYYGWITDNLYA